MGPFAFHNVVNHFLGRIDPYLFEVFLSQFFIVYSTASNTAGRRTYLAGGVFVAWVDYRVDYSIYATHVTHDGTITPGWPASTPTRAPHAGDQSPGGGVALLARPRAEAVNNTPKPGPGARWL